MKKLKGAALIFAALVITIIFRGLTTMNLNELFQPIPQILHLPIIIIIYGFVILGVPLLIMKGISMFK